METFQYQSLRNVIETGGADVVKQFGERFKEMKVEGHRSKAIDTLYMGSESNARKRFQQKDSSGYRGRSFSRSRMGQFDQYSRSRSRGRQDLKNNAGRSTSRPSDNRSRSRGKNSGEYSRCIGCKCKNCEETQNTLKILVDTLGKGGESKEKAPMKVNLCEEEEFSLTGEILVNYTDYGGQVMIVDSGAPVSLCGQDWLKQYLAGDGRDGFYRM